MPTVPDPEAMNRAVAAVDDVIEAARRVVDADQSGAGVAVTARRLDELSVALDRLDRYDPAGPEVGP